MGVNIREKTMIDTTYNRIQTRKRNRDTNVTGKRGITTSKTFAQQTPTKRQLLYQYRLYRNIISSKKIQRPG